MRNATTCCDTRIDQRHSRGMAIFPVANKRKTLLWGLAPVQGDVAAGEERSLTPREDKGIVMGLIGWDGVLG